MTVQEITTKVRAIMNEAGAEETFSLLSEDTVKLSEYIENVIPDACNLVLSVAPVRYINTKSASPQSTIVGGSTLIPLPEDFSRLAFVQLATWVRAVTEVLNINTEEYKVAKNQFTKPGVNKPLCFFSYNGTDEALECMPSGTLSQFIYVPTISTKEEAVTTIKQELFLPVCYMVASLVYNIFENQPMSNNMKAVVMELLKQL